MAKSSSEMAQQMAAAACEFELQRTGHAPKSIAAVLVNDTLVVTLHGILSPVEMELAKDHADRVKLFHRELFTNSCGPLRQRIEEITRVAVREAMSEVATETGTVVQVFLLAGSFAAGNWSGSGLGGQG